MMRRILSVAAMLTIATAGAAFAQAPGGQGQGGGQNRAAMRMQALLQGITLTPAQQQAVDSINTAFQAQMPAFTPGVRPDSASMAQRRALGARRDSTLRAVLTPEQQTAWDHNMETMRANAPQRPN